MFAREWLARWPDNGLVVCKHYLGRMLTRAYPPYQTRNPGKAHYSVPPNHVFAETKMLSRVVLTEEAKERKAL